MHRVTRVAAVLALIGAAACQSNDEPVGPASGPDARIGGPGQFSQRQVAAWFDRAAPAVLALSRTVFADHDEISNTLVFGVENSAVIPGVQRALTALGIPGSAYSIRVTDPIYQVATLRDRWRPTIGGIQIHFTQYLCTMGFNATDGTDRSFITNSHCTGKQGGVENTLYYQPTSSVDNTVIATEVEDPTYQRNIPGCPRGKQCRRSDASRARYSASVASTRGSIAKTTGANNGSITTSGNFTVTSQDNTTTSFSPGTTVNKVGRTTGWTSGAVTQTCVTVNVSGTNISQICQSIVQNPNGSVVVGGGDSGSGVFRITSGDNVQLVGILWGGNSSGTLFVFSPLKNIRDELGALTATP
jgi:hypothetical protein